MKTRSRWKLPICAGALVSALAAPTIARGDQPGSDPERGSGDATAEGITTLEVIGPDPTSGEGGPDEDGRFERNLAVRLGGHGDLPVVGALAEIGNVGYGIALRTAYYPIDDLAAELHLSFTQLPLGAHADTSYSSLGFGAAIRGEQPFESVLAFFADAGAGAEFLSRLPADGPSLDGGRFAVGLFSTIGLELDLFGGVSGEAGVRAQLWFTGEDLLGNDGQGDDVLVLLSPFVAVTAHL